ncbi:MAG: hypothetical protein EP314_04675 [Bacteroidetes bacterium]|nr:MAG: hypothetical protein EP314_04675 [Bacteroidota bacterium]
MINRSTLLSALALICFSAGTMAQVTVSTKLPATVAPGGSFNMELNIAKGDVSGFAKLQQQLPPGFTAEEGESSNATFSFKDQKVKFLWMALPTGDFKVTYKVNVDASLSGNQIIEGTFAYIKDNETEKYVIPKDIIAVKADQGAAAQDAAMAQILAEQQAKEEAAQAAREEAAKAEQPAEEPQAVAEEPVAAAEEKAVETAAEVADNSAAEAEAAAKAEAEAQKAKAAEEKRKADEAEKARKAEEKRQADEAKKTKEAEKAAAVAVEPAKDYNDAMMTTKPGLVFRVQVAAGPNKVDPAIFQTKYGINEAIVIEEHEGLFKYVVGEFGSYRPAKTFSNELRDNNSVDGPFVTAYNNGTRIHVKEALDIAGQ